VNKFGARVKRLRLKEGLSQIELAKKLEIDRQTIISMEKDDNIPTGNNLIKMADALNTSIDYLVCKTDNDPQEFNELFRLYARLSSDGKIKVMSYCIKLAQEEGII
jgi:transcriptional regulator with XRE-family HTH domain